MLRATVRRTSHLALLCLALASCRRPPDSADDATSQAGPAPEDVGRKLESTVAGVAPGARRLDVFYGDAMTEDERQSFGVNLETDRCYWLIGAAESTVDELALFLYAPGGKRVEAEKKSMRPVLHFCPSQAGRYRLEAKVPRGKGTYQVGLYTTP